MQLFEAVEDSELMAHAQDDTELFQMQQEPKESVAMGPRTRPPKLWFVWLFYRFLTFRLYLASDLHQDCCTNMIFLFTDSGCTEPL